MANVLDVPIGNLLSLHPEIQRTLAGLGFADLASTRGGIGAETGLPLLEACKRRNVGVDRVVLALERARKSAGILEWPSTGGEEATFPGPDATVVDVLDRLPGSHEAFHEFGVHPCQCVRFTVAEAAAKFGVPLDKLLARLRQG